MTMTSIMPTLDVSYALITQKGSLRLVDMEKAKTQAYPHIAKFGKLLVDYRLADFDQVRVLELDDIADALIQDVPKKLRIAVVVNAQLTSLSKHLHLINVCHCGGLEAELFNDIDSAHSWLISDISSL